MSASRRITAAAIARLRAFIETGGRPYVTSDGALSVSSRVAGAWNSGSAQDRQHREDVDAAFFKAMRHDVARTIITRAVRMCGVRQPLGHIVMGAA